MRLKILLGKRSYYIYIGSNILQKLKKMLPSGRGFVITDRNVNRYWGKKIKALGLPIYIIPPGERSKSLGMAERIYKALLRYGLDRQGYLVSFGGGVVGDLTGYVAATYMRGIRHIQVPTTLMAMVDSSIGGKTGVNLAEGKNLIGCFWQPEFVFMDIKLLNTLPKREFKNGLAEVIKYGVIKDRRLFEYLEKKGEKIFEVEPKLWIPIINKCAKIKADIVSKDERETKGIRTILNYGHTIGHAMEASSKYKGITHGEAVAVGMITAAKLSNRLGYLSEKEANRQINLITSTLSLNRTVLFSDNVKNIKYDKKIMGGRLRFVLADRIGHVFVTDKVQYKDLWQI